MNTRASFSAKFGGVLSILKYNWHFYAASLGVLVGIGAILCFLPVPPWAEALLIAAAIPTAFWSIGSLLVSCYIYDYAGVTRWAWLPHVLSFTPQRWVNIHAGLDESTPALGQFFPGSDHIVLDIYDPEEMTEPSIARARLLHPSVEPALAARLEALPLADSDRDTVFLLFAAHEIRHAERRTRFFREVARVLAPSGQIVLVEHLRDWQNFVAFGPGFLHFHSRREWIRVAHAAGLTVAREDKVTPFVRCFVISKAGA